MRLLSRQRTSGRRIIPTEHLPPEHLPPGQILPGQFQLGFNISEAFPYPGITGQNWSPSREIPGSRDLTFFLNKEK